MKHHGHTTEAKFLKHLRDIEEARKEYPLFQPHQKAIFKQEVTRLAAETIRDD